MEIVLEYKQTSSAIEAPLMDTIVNRKSSRAYSNRAVEPEKIKSLFEAARWAPSSVNEQPWSYIYATHDQPELWARIFEPLNENNRVWVKDAPLLIVSLTRKNFTRNGRLNTSAKYDLGGANALLSLQAVELGLNVHQMGGFDAQALRINLNIPDTFEVGVVLAIGYPGDPELLPVALKQREFAPRVRFLQEAFVMNKPF
jgi:nitroreductase